MLLVENSRCLFIWQVSEETVNWKCTYMICILCWTLQSVADLYVWFVGAFAKSSSVELLHLKSPLWTDFVYLKKDEPLTVLSICCCCSTNLITLLAFSCQNHWENFKQIHLLTSFLNCLGFLAAESWGAVIVDV